jgi:Ran GTPase-activating protein (RanGAP) involved in mRNA processing and transport
VTAPTAEPVAPCAVELLDDMINWLEQDIDIVAEQEPRIDFVRGSILGKTTVGGGTSVDLCKQVVGPRGIKPILDAVAKNSHIDRFLLGNNIVGDEGAKVIADFMASEASKRVYNFYVSVIQFDVVLVVYLCLQIAGNSISPEGIREIAASLTTNDTVTALWLKRNPIMPQGAKYLASMLSMNTTLETLDLVNTGIRDEGVIAVMNALQSNPSSALKHLYLGCNAEGPSSAIAIRDYLLSGHSKLTSLFASSTRLGDEGIITLAEGLKNDTKLERLGLESVRMGDAGAKALADALEHHPSIVFLDLGFRKGTYEMGEKANDITDEGLFYLAEKLIGPANNRRKNTLRLLDLTNNSISKEGAEEFEQRYLQGNDQLLRVHMNQKGPQRNIGIEHKLKAYGKENSLRYFDVNASLTQEELQERERVKEALDPKHISEIYSIYRGKVDLPHN